MKTVRRNSDGPMNSIVKRQKKTRKIVTDNKIYFFFFISYCYKFIIQQILLLVRPWKYI